MKPTNYGPFYAFGLYPKLAEVFRAHGYALAIHGSLARDMDLIAVPWIDTATDPQDVIDECVARFAFDKRPQVPEQKPLGRVAYRVPFSFGDCSMDVSFTPRGAT